MKLILYVWGVRLTATAAIDVESSTAAIDVESSTESEAHADNFYQLVVILSVVSAVFIVIIVIVLIYCSRFKKLRRRTGLRENSLYKTIWFLHYMYT